MHLVSSPCQSGTVSELPPCPYSSFSSLSHLTRAPYQKTFIIHASGRQHDGVKTNPSVTPSQSVTIISSSSEPISPQPPPSPSHLPVDLDFSTALNSISSSSPSSTANISAPDFSVFTTDPQSTWLPNSASALPAPSAHQLPNLPESLPQDFVLFDSPPTRPSLNRPATSLPSSQRRHSSHHRRDKLASSASAQKQRVAQLFQDLSSVNANRFAHLLYAPSAPSSSENPHQQSSSPRPPVPLFNQDIAEMMNAADVDLDEFPAFHGGVPPAVLPALDFGGGSMSSSTSNLGTVSPQDLLMQEPFLSAPNSSAFTALTSPSIYDESPDFDSVDVSPLFDSVDFDGANDPWYPLFPRDSDLSPEPTRSLNNSPAVPSDDVGSVMAAGEGKKSSPLSPLAGSGRHSSVAGVSARKRDKPLPPIIIEDPNDNVAMKRARNTLAARKSRERKAQRLEELEDRIMKLEAERDHWKQMALAQSDG
ncbi:hypothetical protein RJ55_00772 [Drechmeria coniospora]|nr:hypothetical protein RJ55_00772 [Drechmeria coniospora]